MKLLCLTLFAAASLMQLTSAQAQTQSQTQSGGGSPSKTNSPASGDFPFAKGHWQVQLMQNFAYSNTNTDAPNTPGHSHFASLELGADYFVADGFGIGLALNAINSGADNDGSKTSTDQWLAYGNLEYGFRLGRNFNMYGRAAIGIGHIYYKNSFSGTPSDKTNFGIFGYQVEAGAPIRLAGNSGVYLTPALSWNYQKTRITQGYTAQNGLQLGLSLQSFLGCPDYQCDSRHGFSNSRHIYDQGHSFIDFTSSGLFGLGTEKSAYDNSSVSQKENYVVEDISVGYGYYVLPYIAIGGVITAGGSSDKNKAADFTTSSSVWELSPMLQFNLPVENGWNNTFFRFGMGFGSQKSKIEAGSTSNSTTYHTFTYYGLAGYNDFISKKLALTPRIGYQWETDKDPSSGEKTKSHGLIFNIGISLFL
jgi:hypothetical protein